MLDTQTTRSVANPAASANVNSTSIDLTPAGGAFIQNGQLRFDIPAMPNLGNGETHTITIQDSADNSNWAAAVGYATIVTTGPASGGSPAAIVRRSIMQGLRRYVRINIARGTGGNVTAQSVQFGLEG